MIRIRHIQWLKPLFFMLTYLRFRWSRLGDSCQESRFVPSFSSRVRSRAMSSSELSHSFPLFPKIEWYEMDKSPKNSRLDSPNNSSINFQDAHGYPQFPCRTSSSSTALSSSAPHLWCYRRWSSQGATSSCRGAASSHPGRDRTKYDDMAKEMGSTWKIMETNGTHPENIWSWSVFICFKPWNVTDNYVTLCRYVCRIWMVKKHKINLWM